MIEMRRVKRVCVGMVLAGVSLVGHADSVRYGGITYEDVEIRGFSNGVLVVTMPSGAERQLPLAAI